MILNKIYQYQKNKMLVQNVFNCQLFIATSQT